MKNHEKRALKASTMAKSRKVAQPILAIIYGDETDHTTLKIHCVPRAMATPSSRVLGDRTSAM